MGIPALYYLYQRMCCYVDPCTTQEQTLYQRMFCCMIPTAVGIYCCVRTRRAGGVERRGEAKTAMPAPLWHGSAYHCCYRWGGSFSCPLYPPLLWHSSAFFCCTPVVLLSYTHGRFVGCWMFFFCCVLCCATTVLRTAVVLLLYGVAGWTGSWVCPWARGFFFIL